MTITNLLNNTYPKNLRSYSSITLAFSTPRTPNANFDTLVILTGNLSVTGGSTSNSAAINVQLNTGSGFLSIADISLTFIVTTIGSPVIIADQTISFIVPANASYQLVPTGITPTIVSIFELTL